MSIYNYDLKFLNDISLNKEDKFNIYYNIIINNNNMDNDLYSGLKYFTESQIDKIFILDINRYMFFRYLPNIYLINKYFIQTNNDSNAFHGITKNDNITKEERQICIKNILAKKYIN